MDDHQLWRTLFIIKDFLIQHSEKEFASFDLTDNHTQIQGDSIKIPVDSSTDVMYFLKFYNLDKNITEYDIDNLKRERDI